MASSFTAVERAVVLKGGRRPRPEGTIAGSAPLVVLHPPAPYTAPSTATASAGFPVAPPSSHYFCRHASMLFQLVASRLCESQRYAGIICVGLDDDPSRTLPSGEGTGKAIHLTTSEVVYGWLEVASKDGAAVDLSSPLSFAESIMREAAGRLGTAHEHSGREDPQEEGEACLRTWSVAIDSVSWLVERWGIGGTLEALRALRRCAAVSPVVAVLHPEGVALSDRLAIEDAATTNIYLHYCDMHSSATVPDHGRCRVVRRSSSGRVQDEWAYYKVASGQGKEKGRGLQLLDRSTCPLVEAPPPHEDAAAEGGEPGKSSFLEDLSLKLRLSEQERQSTGQVTLHPQQQTGGEQAPLIYLEEGDVDPDDEDDGLDDDLDI